MHADLMSFATVDSPRPVSFCTFCSRAMTRRAETPSYCIVSPAECLDIVSRRTRGKVFYGKPILMEWSRSFTPDQVVGWPKCALPRRIYIWARIWLLQNKEFNTQGRQALEGLLHNLTCAYIARVTINSRSVKSSAYDQKRSSCMQPG